MRNSGQLLGRFYDRWCTKDPETAAARAVQSIFPDLDGHQLPIKLELLARRRKITDIRFVDFQFDGILARSETNEYRLEINARHSERRKRFTIAHEIGHTFFFDLEESITPRFRFVDSEIRISEGNAGEEYICNLIAAEILMPFTQFEEELNKIPLSAVAILALANKFSASLHATAQRLVQIGRPNLMVCLWRADSSSKAFETVWIAKNRRAVNARTFNAVPGDPILNSFLDGKGFRGRRWLALGGPLDDYFVDAIPLGNKGELFLMVVYLQRDAHLLFQQQTDSSQYQKPNKAASTLSVQLLLEDEI